MCGPYVHTKESLIMSTLTTGTYENTVLPTRP